MTGRSDDEVVDFSSGRKIRAVMGFDGSMITSLDLYPLDDSEEAAAITGAKRFTDRSEKTWRKPGDSATSMDIFLLIGFGMGS